MKKIRFVVASRESETHFHQKTLTGQSLNVFKVPFLELKLYANNTQGLSHIYNQEIMLAKNDPAILVFAHDDLLLLGYYWVNDIFNALKVFDLVGVAGNTRRLPLQPSWVYTNTQLESDELQFLSGVVGHGNTYPPAMLNIYGQPGQQVKLLDGMLLIADSEVLNQHDLKFDERFKFHFYDMDFCRQAELKNLRMGTWPISLVHQSGGNYQSESWHQSYRDYLEKWGD
jgi:GT2 family glycosyltransferase